MSADAILAVRPLEFVWATDDPFLFCVHHDDAYPAGNERMGPAASLAGRNLGNDFELRDGWRMYHGRAIPGFPAHPHRGFETVTLARRGLIDHSDSLGATARFGRGDAQWMTAGRGIVHSEMFPLLDRSGPNPVELFQIWLNLPAADKLAEPAFRMLWADEIPEIVEDGARITTVAGSLAGRTPPSPPPDSWASRSGSHVAIWTIALDAGAEWTLPPTEPGVGRNLYLFAGNATIAGRALSPKVGIRLRPEEPVPIRAGAAPAELLLLQGRPIRETVAQYGPFVMNTPQEIQQAFADYQRTRFGRWPWTGDAPVHPADRGRFARHADGIVEERGS